MDESYSENWISVNRIPTRIITWGCSVEDLKENDQVIFMILGNPGITEFYTEFLSKVYDNVKKPIWIISHAGHEVPPTEYRNANPDFYPDDRLYTVQDQIDHKAYFLKKFVPDSGKVYIVNHSLGAYISLKLLQIPEIAKKIRKCYSLFPMMENMEQTQNAPVAKRLDGFVLKTCVAIAKVIQLLPSTITYYLAYGGIMVTQRIWSPDGCLVESVLQMIKPTVVQNASYLCADELKTIRELDTKVIEENKDKLKFYYGTTDGWCSLENCEKLRSTVSGLDSVICSNGIQHAFIIKYSHAMADIVSEWLNSDLKQPTGNLQKSDQPIG